MEKTNRKALNEGIKEKYYSIITEFLKSYDEEILRTGSAEFAVPVLDAEQNEEWLVVTLKVPTGSRDGDAYDGYAMAEEYRMKCDAKAEKARISAEKKAAKIERDRLAREAKKAARGSAKEEA